MGIIAVTLARWSQSYIEECCPRIGHAGDGRVERRTKGSVGDKRFDRRDQEHLEHEPVILRGLFAAYPIWEDLPHGFGGQTFMPSQLAKIARLRSMIEASGRDIVIEVDGGVTAETAGRCVEAGADALVAGTAVFRGGPQAYAANIRALREA